MQNFENLSEREKAFLTSYIEELLEEHGYFPDAPDVPITDVFVQLREREVRSKPREVPSEALPRQQIDVESGYGRTVELQEAVEKPKFILIGEPGGGKTTTLRYIAINFAIRLARELGLEIDWNGEKLKIFRDFNPTLSLDSAYLPVFVPLGGINDERDVETLVFDAVRELVKNAHEDVKALFDDRNFVRGMLRDWPLMLLFDALDEAGQPVRQGLLNGFGDFAQHHPHVRMIVSMRVANFRELSVPEELRSTYELMPLTESKDRRTFVELWLNRLKTDHPDIQPPEPQAILDIIEHKHGALKNSLENPLMLKMAIEMAFFGGIEALKDAGSRSNFYEFHVKRLFFRALERLGVFKIRGVRWTGERFEFVYLPSDSQLKVYITDNKRTKGRVSDDKQRKEEVKNLFSAVTDALRTLSVEMFQHGGRIARDEADKLSAVDTLNKSLSDFQKDLGNRLKVRPHAGIEFLRKDMGVVGEVGGDLYFMHKTFLEYSFSQWLLERWRENKKAAWRYLRNCLHSPDMREPILLLAGSLKGKELEDFIKRVMHAGSEYEFLFHRDLLMAGLIAGETGYRGRLRDEIISKMPGWRWSEEKLWGWHTWDELWRDAVVAMEYPRSVLSDLVEALENKEAYVRWITVEILDLLSVKAKDIVMKIVAELEHEDRDVQWAAMLALGSLSVRDRHVAMKIAEKLEIKDWGIRAAAVWALGKLGIKDKKVIIKIVERLKDEDRRVREEAVEALGELGIKDKEVVMKIVERLEDEDSNVRYLVTGTLGKLGVKDRDVVMEIVKKLKHKNADVRRAAAGVLGKLGIKDRDVVMKIVERLEDESSDVRAAAVWALGKLGIKARDVVMKIVEKLEHEDPSVRSAAVGVLGLLGVKDRDVAMKIVERLKDKDWKVRHAAVKALGKLGIRDEDVVMKIVEELEDESWNVRMVAVKALSSLGIKDKDGVMKIVERMEDEEWHVRETAVKALGSLGIKDRNVVMKILERLEDEDSNVRAAAVEALSELGIRNKDMVVKIVERLKDEVSDVRAAAVWALEKLGIRDNDVVMKIVERLEDKDLLVRYAGVEALGELSDKPEVIEKVIKRYAGPVWKQKLISKLPQSKLGEFIRNMLRIREVWFEALYTLLQKLTVLRCRESVEAFIGWWKFRTAVWEACPQCKTFLETVKNGMFDFKGADLLVESLSLVVAAWNPLLKILPFLPKLASAFLSLILSFLAIAFLLNAFPLAYKCHISCPRKVKKRQNKSV